MIMNGADMPANASTQSTSKDIAKIRRFTAEDLYNVNSFDDAVSLLQKVGYSPADIIPATELGDGFLELKKEEKAQLTGVPFLLLEAVWDEGDFAEDGYFQLKVVTKDGRKFRMSDGGTGIARQLHFLMQTRGLDYVPPMVCDRGLRSSTYDFTDETTGKTTKATTFYLDTSTVQ
jgi:hypothetical protein